MRRPGTSSLVIDYPVNETLFPPDIAPPAFRWTCHGEWPSAWRAEVVFGDGGPALTAAAPAGGSAWTPSDAEWRTITRRSTTQPARVSVIGLGPGRQATCQASVSIRTSADPVDASLFYREVVLPFIDAVKDPSRIRWRFGPVSSTTQPPVVLDNLPVCGNCHSFSADGKQFGMDIDYANDKGSYALLPVQRDMVLDASRIITWCDYKQEDKEPTFGLLSQISPDGRYALSTVKDRSVFVPRPDLAFSQLFFPVKGILAFYDRQTKVFRSLPGADDPAYVQSNPTWSPDGRTLIFARAVACTVRTVKDGAAILLTEADCSEFLRGKKTIQFDLYRIPFNDGKGGKAEPLAGASGDGMSNFFPKYSPDGKWIVFCKARQFMLLQPDSEMYIIPSQGGPARRLRANTRRMNSWHSWSPNGRWLVFTSKANGPYSQLFLTHIDAAGESSPAVELAHFTSADRAANIPEFVNQPAEAIGHIREQFLDDQSYGRAADEFAKGGDWARAAEQYDKALLINPHSVQAHTGLGPVLMHLNRRDDAIRHLQAALEIAPTCARAHIYLGDILGASGQLEEATAHMEKALAAEPDSPEAIIRLGSLLVKRKQLDQAIAQFDRAIAMDPNNAAPHSGRGGAYSDKGDSSRAIADFTRAIELDPHLTQVYNNRGAAYAHRNEYDHAIADYTKALELDPRVALVYKNRGFARCYKADYEQAIADFTKAIELDPRFANAYWGRAGTFFLKRDYDKAWADLTKCRELGGTIDPKFVNELRKASGRNE